MSRHVSTELRLTVTTGPDRGKSESFRLPSVRIGRDRSNDFSLTDNFVSNFHCRISEDGGKYRYEDLGSRHGSLVTLPRNIDKKSEEKQDAKEDNVLVNGSLIYIGCTEILVALSETLNEDLFDLETEIPTQDFFNSRQTMAFSQGVSFPAFDSSIDFSNDLIAPENQNTLFITSSYSRQSSVAARAGASDKVLDLLFELASKLNATTLLNEILELIAETAFEVFPSAYYFSITMADASGRLEPQTHISRTRNGPLSPEDEEIVNPVLMHRAIQRREGILFAAADEYDASQLYPRSDVRACMCIPLVGQTSILGALQVETTGETEPFTEHDLDLLSLLGSSAAFAIERAKLNDNLEKIFESFVDASITAIEARDPTTAGHSHRVAHYTLELAKEVNIVDDGRWGSRELSFEELRELKFAALLHDFGKICVHEHVLQKEARLPTGGIDQIGLRFQLITSLFDSELWKVMHQPKSRALIMTPEQREERLNRFRHELNNDFLFLKGLNTAPFVTQSEINRIRAIAKRTYLDLDGVQQPYLTPFEVENLSVQKGTLNEAEWVEMRSHARWSEMYLQQIPWTPDLQAIPRIAGAHHEKLDGSGYPRGLTAEQISLQVRMLTVADIFDALTASDRPYRKAAPKERAIEILKYEADAGKLDSELVTIFERRVAPRLKV